MNSFPDYSDETYVDGMKKDEARSVRGKLKVLNGRLKDREFPVNKQFFTIGRSNDCCISLNDKRVSRIHAQLVESMGKEILEDLGSRNGTVVNGRNVTKKILADGDVIQIGETSLMFLK
ncbi:MAG TPA: FHA domain-containing protein [Firmicutes bacterium]|nr:FHA domain-containing protein [Bacillota bacterium]